MDYDKVVAVLYSFEQNSFHLETLQQYLDSNIKATLKKKDHCYRLIALASNQKQGLEITHNFEKVFPEEFKQFSLPLAY